MDLVTGDVLQIKEPIWGQRGKPPIGEREYVAEIIRESYGELTGQHTFTLEIKETVNNCHNLLISSVIRRKGRNLYSNVVRLISRAANHKDRQRIKHEIADCSASRYR